MHRTRADIKPIYDKLVSSASARVQQLEAAGYVEESDEVELVSTVSHEKPAKPPKKLYPAVTTSEPPKSVNPLIEYPNVANISANPNPKPVQRVKQRPRPNQRPQQRPQQGQNPNEPDNYSMEGAIITERPNVRFGDVAGLEAAKQALNEAVIMPIKVPHLFDKNTQPWKGILLYGPPGTGKSFLAKAVAGEANDSAFLTVSTAELTSKYVGESEKLIKSLFETARANRPSIIFIDEIDSLVSERGDNESESGRRIKTEFLIQMDGVGVDNRGVLVIGATNLPWALDSAMRRRFEKRIYVPLPGRLARYQLIKNKLKGAYHKLEENDIRYLAENTHGWSGADIGILIRDALMQPIREVQTSHFFKRGTAVDKNGRENNNLWIPCSKSDRGAKNIKWSELNPDEIGKLPATYSHFIQSLKKGKPSVSQSDIIKYKNWTREYGEEGT